VKFMLGVDVGRDVSVEELQRTHEAVVIAIGSRVPRDLGVPGRELDGVHFAMDYLYQRNRWVAAHQRLAETNGDLGPAPADAVAPPPEPEHVITAQGKHVVVIGGGDTGADCVANAHREDAASVTQIELLGEPPKERPDDVTPWPQWPMKMRSSYALEEGGERHFSMSTARFAGDENGHVRGLEGSRVEGPPDFAPIPGTEFTLPADLVLLAMGFLSPEQEGLLEELGVARDRRGNVKAGAYATSVEGVFAAGDARRGQSLIVWAINEGRQCARVVNRYLEGIGAGEDNAVDSGVPSQQAGAAPDESEKISGPPNKARFAGETV
jgi:glutamate synthase (NADPH/NADH) small chain